MSSAGIGPAPDGKAATTCIRLCRHPGHWVRSTPASRRIQGGHGVREAERLPRECPVPPIAVPPHSRIAQVCGAMQMRCTGSAITAPPPDSRCKRHKLFQNLRITSPITRSHPPGSYVFPCGRVYGGHGLRAPSRPNVSNTRRGYSTISFLRLWTKATTSRCSASGTWNFARVAPA